MFRFLLLFVAIFCLNNGFLLNNNPFQNNTLGVTDQYLTIEDRKKLQQDIEKQHQDLISLRKEQNQALNILTSQLQQTLVELDKRFQSVSNKNSTCEQVFMENAKLKREMQDVQNAYKLLENTTRHLESELSATKNRTMKLERELGDVKQLKNVQNLQNLSTVNSKLENIDTKVNLLVSHEQARNDDFLALHNLTTFSIGMIQNREQTLNKTLRDAQISCNHSIAFMENSFTSNLALLRQELQSSNNKTGYKFVATKEALEQLNRTIHRQIVAITAQAAGRTYSSGEIVRFTDFKTSIGMPTQTSFASTGKFECTYPGIYLIALTLMSGTNDAYFSVYKNDQILNYLMVGQFSAGHREVNGDFVTELQTGDKVYVKCERQQVVHSWSMIAITKLD